MRYREKRARCFWYRVAVGQKQSIETRLAHFVVRVLSVTRLSIRNDKLRKNKKEKRAVLSFKKKSKLRRANRASVRFKIKYYKKNAKKNRRVATV